jgi:CheY-like chemotaxis protein
MIEERTPVAPLILVVDDFEDNRAMYVEYLGHAGYRVIQAENGREAVEKAREAQPAIVVMDLSLPIMDGWEATRRLKEDPRTKDIPVIVLSGYALAGDPQSAKEAGCDAFLTNPCLPKELLDKVQSLLDACH